MFEFFLFFLLVLPLTTFVHEMGHILMARILKIQETRMELGLGPIVMQCSLFGTKIIIRAVYFIGGLSTNEPNQPLTYPQIGFISLGGPLFNGVVALWLLPYIYSSEIMFLLFFLQIWVCFVNLLPYKRLDRKSDGFVFLQSMWLYYKERRSEGV